MATYARGILARSAFVSGMDLGLATGACAAAAGCLIALLALPSRTADHPGAGDHDHGPASQPG